MKKVDYKKEFYRAILSLKNEEECEKLFEDLLTPNELDSIPQRLEVARLLIEGQSFNDVSAKTGASTATIGRVSRCLKGGTGGYKEILDRIK